MTDLQYQNDVDQRAMGWQAEQSRRNGQQQASAIGQQQTAGLIGGIGNTIGAYSSFSTQRAKTASAAYGNSVDTAARTGNGLY